MNEILFAAGYASLGISTYKLYMSSFKSVLDHRSAEVTSVMAAFIWPMALPTFFVTFLGGFVGSLLHRRECRRLQLGSDHTEDVQACMQQEMAHQEQCLDALTCFVCGGKLTKTRDERIWFTYKCDCGLLTDREEKDCAE